VGLAEEGSPGGGNGDPFNLTLRLALASDARASTRFARGRRNASAPTQTCSPGRIRPGSRVKRAMEAAAPCQQDKEKGPVAEAPLRQAV